MRSKPAIRGTRLKTGDRRYFKPLSRTVLYLPPSTWWVLDVLFGVAAFLFAQWATPYRESAGTAGYDPLLAGLAFGGLLATLRHILEAHDLFHMNSLVRILSTSLVSSAAAAALLMLVMNGLLYLKLGRFVAAYAFLASAALTALSRVATRGWVARARHKVLFIGGRERFRDLSQELTSRFPWFFDGPRSLPAEGPLGRFRERLLSALSQERFDEIIVEDHCRAEDWVMEYGLEISKAGCVIRPLSLFLSELKQEEDPETFSTRRWLTARSLTSGAFTGAPGKRAFDILFSLLGLALSLAPGLLVALGIKLTMPGPILYRQKRVGQYGTPFEILKFRSMGVDAEREGAVWAREKDARATPFGAFLRKTRLDELPQFWNILKGEMSFVGPRPERPEFVEPLERKLPHYHLRHLVKPGLTGWAQIRFRYGGSQEDAKRKLAFDLYYVGHCSLSFDLSIVLKTLVAMARGAR
jgi:exopolysaccharide biosynthesis polyprenyl glycosylphosphotransferase